MPAIAGSFTARIARAQAAKCSNDDVMIVGSERVTPVARMALRAVLICSGDRPAVLKSIPANPFTCKSTKPGNVSVMPTKLLGPGRVPVPFNLLARQVGFGAVAQRRPQQRG